MSKEILRKEKPEPKTQTGGDMKGPPGGTRIGAGLQDENTPRPSLEERLVEALRRKARLRREI